MIKQLIETFRKPSAAVLAQHELENAQRSLLEAHSAVEYSKSMVTYNESRVARLSAYVREVS